MYPEDRVLVGVINRRADLEYVRHSHWYRIPHGQATHGIHAEYLAFFLSRAFGSQNSAIHYYARRTGHELVRRRDLLPDEPDHPRADGLYYKIQLGELRDRVPPILNPSRRPVVFIYTTWDRFVAAQSIEELYSTADAFVDRVFYALRGAGITADRHWEVEKSTDDGGAQLRIPCELGNVVATTARPNRSDRVVMPVQMSVEAIQTVIAEIRERIAALGGPLAAPAYLED